MDVLDDAGLPFWYTFASCLGKCGGHDDPWFDLERHAEAVAVCGGCPVRVECLDLALSIPTSDDTGIWGGTTPNQRAGMRKRARTAA